MRVVKRNLKIVEFQHAATYFGDEIVRWNTEQTKIAGKQTQPLMMALILDEWGIVARQNLPEGVRL